MSSAWDPQQHLDLVRRLTALRGATTETFFQAHGLGDAYASPGRYDGKRRRINAALTAAAARGDAAAVMHAAHDLLDAQPTSQSDLAGHDQEEVSMAPEGKIFVSHANLDRALAEAFVDTLRLGGVPSEKIFFSSQPGMGITAGSNVDDALRGGLTSAPLVIELITETFLVRPICLMELGGAWARQIPTFPIVVPPLTYKTVIETIGNFQMTSWSTTDDRSTCFDQLHDSIAQHADIMIKASHWNRAVKSFESQLPALLMPPAGSTSPAPAAATPATRSTTGAIVKKGLEFGSWSRSRGSSRPRLNVQVRNLTDSTKSTIIKATFFDEDSGIVDTDTTALNDIEPSSTRTLTFLNVPDFHDVTFDVEI